MHTGRLENIPREAPVPVESVSRLKLAGDS